MVTYANVTSTYITAAKPDMVDTNLLRFKGELCTATSNITPYIGPVRVDRHP